MIEVSGWSDLLLLPQGTPPILVLLFGMAGFLAFVLFPLYFFTTFAERKLIADLQARVGPNRAGSHGMLQGPADFLKELARAPSRKDSVRKKFWQMIFVVALYSSLGALPLSADLVVVNSEISVLLPLLSFSFAVLATTLIGLESSYHEAMLSSLRAGFQHWSALLPAFISVITVGVVAESLEWKGIGAAQGSGFISAMIFQQPLLILSFLVFQASGMILFGVPPFQPARRARQLLQSDQATSSFHEFYSFFAWCILSAALFLGAWEFFGLDEPGGFRTILGAGSVLLKAMFLFLASKVLAKALPQLRLEQITDFSWKVLAPVSIFTLVLCAAFKTLGGQG